ncbi:MAG: hypothetical protein UV01_C0009G0061, partial [Parcubacteria group bacterium GW2011_GWA2_42_14]
MKKKALFISIFFILGFAVQYSYAAAPVILSSPAPQAINVISPGAQITWSTDVLSDSQVYYGTSNTSTSFPYYSSGRCDSGGNVTSHCVNLTLLSTGVTYYFKVKSCNTDGCIEGSGYQFTTTSGSSSGGSGGGSSSTSCPSNIASLLGSGCHDMGNAYFNSAMDQYVNYNGSTVYYCGTNYISGCATGGGGSNPPGSPYLSLPGSSASPIYLSWTTVSGATSYEVWRRTPPSTGTFTSITTGLTGLSYNDSGVTSGTSYEYYIKACNAYGCSSSNYATISVSGGTSSDTTPPSAPANFSTYANSSSQVTLTWAASTDNIGVTGYKIFKNNSYLTTTAALYYYDYGVSPSTAYSYYVKAADAAGNESSPSLTAYATTPSTSTTTASTSCSSTVVSLLGSGCHDMGNAYFNGEMTQYVYYNGSTVYYCNTTYISGCTTVGGGNIPTSPSSLRQISSTQNSISLAWYDNSSGEDKFNLERTVNNTSSWTLVSQLGANIINYTDTAVTAGTYYDYRIQACLSGYGCSGYAYLYGVSTSASTATSTPSDVTLPGIISNLSANNPTSNSVTLSWTATGDDGTTGTAYSYSVKYSTAPITTESAWQTAYYVTSGVPVPYPAGTSQTMVVSGLSPNTTYYFAIKAYDDAGNISPLSNSPPGKILSGTVATTTVDMSPPYVTTFGFQTEGDGRIRAGAMFSESIDESTLTDSNVYIILSGAGTKIAGTITKFTAEKGVGYLTSTPASAGTDYQLVIKKNINDLAGNQMALDYISQKFQASFGGISTSTPPTNITQTETPKLVNWGLSVGTDGNSTIGLSFNVEMDYATFNDSSAYIYKSSDPSLHLPVTFQKRPYHAMFVLKLTPGIEYVSVVKSSVKSLNGLSLGTDYICKFVALTSGYITSCPQESISSGLPTISPEVSIKYGILEAQVLDSEEKPVDKAGVHIFKEDFSSNFGGTSDASGLFKNSIQPGIYYIEVFPPTGRTDLIKPEPVKFEILGGETKKLIIRFGILSKTITGTVLFSNDASVADAEVGAYSSAKNQWVSAFTDSSGRYTMKVGSGKWTVGIRPRDPAGAKWSWSGPFQEVVFTVNPGQELILINFRIPVSNSKIIIKAVDDLGNPIENAGIIANTISSSQSYSESKTSPEFRKTDARGKAEFSLAPALYYIRGVIDIERGYLNSEEQPVQITKDEIREMRLVFKRRSIVETLELSGLSRMENGSPLDAYIWSWSETGKFFETRANENGKFNVKLAKGEKWHIGAGKVLNGISYKADDIVIDPENQNISLEIILFKQAELAPPVTVAQSATQQVVVQTQDGAKTVIPSGAVSGGATINVELKPTTEAPSQAGAQIVGTAYDINITDAAGKAITKLTKDAEIIIPYAEEELKAKGINEDRLIPSFFDASLAAWLKIDNYTIDKEKNVVIIRVNHLTRFAIVAAADITPPDAPSNVKISALTEGKVKISWVNPAKDFHHVKIYRSEANGESGTVVLNDLTGDSTTDSGLSGGKTYYYLLRSIDPAGNESNNTEQTKIALAGIAAKPQVQPETKKLPPGIAVKLQILRNLSAGFQGDDVKAIQELLLKEGVYPEGLITGFFGNLTKQAVI